MKLSIKTIPLISFLLTSVYKFYYRIFFIKFEFYGKLPWFERRQKKLPTIFGIWHRDELVMPFINRNTQIYIMVSQSTDGELLAQSLHRFGLKTVRGSSSKGGKEALNLLVDKCKDGEDVLFAADGPKGPRFELKAGIVSAAMRTGSPIMLSTCGVNNKFIFNKSWDKGQLPKPFSKVVEFFSPPIFVKPELNEKEFEDTRKIIEDEFKRLTQNAENYYNIEYKKYNPFTKWFILNPKIRKIIMFPFSIIYYLIIFIRNLLFDLKIIVRVKVPSKVISVGNLTMGGSGKTPFVRFLASKLAKAANKKVVVVTRELSDEPKLYSLDNISVVTGRRKYRAVAIAYEKYKPDYIIVDDGFQHRYFRRNRDIVLIDINELENESFLIPSGKLREPFSSLKRANLVVLTRANEIEYNKFAMKIESHPIDKLKDKIKKINPKINIIETAMRSSIDVDLKGKRVLIFSSIAKPESLAKHARALGAIVEKQLIYPDHYLYKDDDYKELKVLETKYDYLLTTEKDKVKLNRSVINFKVIKINLEIVGKDGESSNLFN